MDFQGSPSILRRLLHSGEYSDLTLTCQGEEFKLHKAVVCPQSPVIAAALRGNFKEARINALSADAFDVSTVKRMVDFMYTGDYHVIPTASQIVGELPFMQDEATLFPGQPDNNDATEWNAKGRRQSLTVTREPDALLCHVRVNAIAEYYDVPELSQLTTSRIQHMLRVSWSADAFLGVVGEVLTLNGNRALHELIAAATADHIEELVDVESFAELEVTSSFAVMVLRNCALRLRANNLDFTVQQDGKAQLAPPGPGPRRR